MSLLVKCRQGMLVILWMSFVLVQARYLGDLVDVAACGNRSMRIQV